MAEDLLAEWLPTWLRSVQLEPGGERQAAIRAAADDLAKTVAGHDALSLVLLAHGVVQDEAFELVRDAVQAHDETFGCQPDDLETRLAACAAIVAVTQRTTVAAGATAHGVLSARWSGLASPVEELPAIAEAAISRRSEAVRVRRGLGYEADVATPFKDVPSHEPDGSPSTNADFEALKNAARAALDALRVSNERLAKAITTRVRAGDEELDLVWWAFAGQSERAHASWSEVAAGSAGLLAGIEMAEKTVFDVELPSTRELLSSVLASVAARPLTLMEAIEDTAQFIGDVDLPEGHQLLPVLSCISEHRALDGDAGWPTSLKRWSIDPSRTTNNIDLAEQVLRELLAARGL